jgi:hypothetical protein
LDEAWAGNGTRIIQFIAAGGTGKTKLIRYWLDLTEPEHVIAWSFYSQGSSEDKQTSATPFFSHVFEVLKANKRLETDFTSPEAKGEYLAQLLNQQRCVLVLDGLEPMQYVDQANRGELKDRALRALLKNLAGTGTDLCIITTRIAVHELSDRAHVSSHKLGNLALEDGMQLLKSLGVKGRKDELEKAVVDYGRHALALSLLGNLLRIRHQGDVHKHLTLKNIITTSKNKENQYAFKVMQAYAEYFAGQTELALLFLLGLFDHPIEIAVLRVLWAAQIPELTAGIDEGDWWEAIEALRHDYQLLTEQVGSEELDCHPLLHEYFGKRLEEGNPEVWRQAHTCLYEYYKNLPEKEFPDTLEEMQPLFHAVAHGCRAGLHQDVLEQVYCNRMRRNERAYVVHYLGAFNEDLSVLAYFFNTPWSIPVKTLGKLQQASLLNWVGYRLHALGFLRAAVEPTYESLKFLVSQHDWIRAASQASNLSELHLLSGSVNLAIKSAKESIRYADLSDNLFERMARRTTLADALHQLGDRASIRLAFDLFQTAELLQIEREPIYKYMYSLQGFRYCDLLLTMGNLEDVVLRATQTLEVSIKYLGLMDISLCKLLLGRALSQLNYINQAVNGLKDSGYRQILPLGLLARAKIYLQFQDYLKAHADLQEVYDIVKPSGMRLHLTDYHLEMARLLIAESKEPASTIKDHVDKAEKLINDTGYHRRDKELAELKEQLQTLNE